MQAKQKVIYIENGIEVAKNIHLFNKGKILRTLFKHPFHQENTFDNYYIKEEVSFIHFKNVIFYRDVKFLIPKDTVLILEDCHFKGGIITFIGGSVQLIHPDFNPTYYANRVLGMRMQDLSISMKEDSREILSVTATAEKFYLDSKNRISGIQVEGKDITLKNIRDKKVLNLVADKIMLDNCCLYVNYDDVKDRISSKNLIIKNSNMMVFKLLSEDAKLETSHLSIQDSSILFSVNDWEPAILKCDVIQTRGSEIKSQGALLDMKCPNLELDEDTTLEAGHEIMLFHDSYKSSNDDAIQLTLSKILMLSEQTKIPKQMISLLKGIAEVAKKEIIESAFMKEQELSSASSKKGYVKRRIRKLTKVMYDHRKIGSYNSYPKKFSSPDN